MSNETLEFGVGDDRGALEQLKENYSATAEIANLRLDDVLAAVVAAYDGWIGGRLGNMAGYARLEVNAITASILVGLGVDEDVLLGSDENEVDYLVDEALNSNGFDVA